MILIYLDESGVNYQAKDGLYLDGPFLIFGAMCVYEDVYWSLERLFCQLIEDYFGIDNWLNQEVHATDIWAGLDLSKNLEVAKRRAFFDEFLQMCGKFGLHYVFSFNLKHSDKTILEKNLDFIRTAKCLLISLEHRLADEHQTGVLICDATTDSYKLTAKNLAKVDCAKENLSSSQALLKEFHAMTSWRTVKQGPNSFAIKPKYRMEAMSAYLIDRVHFAPSNDSLFLQMCDILTFLTQRCLVHDYLLVAASGRIDTEKVPLTTSGLVMMKDKVCPSTYDNKSGDVIFFHQIHNSKAGFLFDFRLMPELQLQISEHYSKMQPLTN